MGAAIAAALYAKRAAEATKQAATSADLTLEHAKETTWKQLRAYVGIESVTHHEISDYDSRPDILAICYDRIVVVSVRNYGLTPAKVRLGVFPDILNIEQEHPQYRDPAHYHSFEALPGAVVSIRVRVPLNQVKLLKLERGTATMFLYTVSDYDYGTGARYYNRRTFFTDRTSFKTGHMEDFINENAVTSAH